MLEGPELATSPQGLRLISKLRPPAGHTLGAARCMGWAAAGTASSGVDQTVSGPCGEEGTGRVPSPSRPPLPQWGARAASTVRGEASPKHSESCELVVTRLGAWN